MKITCVLLFLVLTGPTSAKGPTTRSTTKPGGTLITPESAIAKCNTAVNNAEVLEKSSEFKAYKDLVGVLENSKKAELKAGNLERANTLDEKIKETQGRIDVLNGDATEFIVYGNRGWQELGPIKKGQKLSIDVFGQWSDDKKIPERTCGPEGVNGRWMLIGQVGEEGTVVVGKHLDFTAPKTAELRLGMSDSGHINGGGKLILIVRPRQ